MVCDDSWYNTMFLAGRSSCLPGLPGRLEKELRQLADDSRIIGMVLRELGMDFRFASGFVSSDYLAS
ncbi:unnamed protein product [Urochloa humidicola]